MLKLTTDQDIKDFTVGCCFFGTGGGGNASFGERMLRDALELGKEIVIVDSNDIDDKDWIICPYLMGTSGPETDETKQEKIKQGLSIATVGNMPAAATDLLLKTFGENVTLSAIIPYEIGAAATSSAVATAAMLGIPTIDADFVGRSVPEATQMLPALYGIDLCPTASSDAFGNETIISKAVNRHMIERIGKHIALASFGLIGQATLLHQAEVLKKYMLSGTLSKAFAVGKILREAKNTNKGVETILRELVGSKKVFEGVIATFTGYDEKGYYVGEIVISGKNEFEGSTLKIWFKNENHIAWKDEAVYLTSPDLISIIDQNLCEPYVNNQLKEGLQVTVYGTPAHSAWHEEKALEANSPRYYGFNFDAKFMDR
ncbi:MAG: hypothetical protein A3E87_07350 [Gammaproteobacteria bacterium RIFCSPHIGHO2_12_FULL_35_23]|nr:MAG: hypothetical protein A3E87_07350 [Gammaproteobacteria bacterium RIFCSPHIGHO2_12_FULL_35_23]